VRDINSEFAILRNFAICRLERRFFILELSMNSATWVKFLAGILLFGAWLTLVLMRIVPPGPLVDAIGYALVGLGIYHASANGSSVSPLLASLLARLTPTDEPTSTTTAVTITTPVAQTPSAATEPASASAVSAAPGVTVIAPSASAAGTLQ
jgi:hypothetical protein